MLRKVIAGLALGGAIALGSVGIASAATTDSPGNPSAPTPHAFSCTKAPEALAKIASFEAKAAQRLTVLQAREAKAQAAGDTTVAKRVDNRITRVQGIQTKLGTLQQKVESLCPGAVAAPSTSQS